MKWQLSSRRAALPYWRRTGTVLAAVKLEDGQVVVQVVMNNGMEPDSIFRVRDDANTLHIEPLPYSLEE